MLAHSWVLLQVAFEGVEPVAPVDAIGLEPSVHVGQRLRPQCVEPAAPLGPSGDEAGVAQDAEVLETPGWLRSSSATSSYTPLSLSHKV